MPAIDQVLRAVAPKANAEFVKASVNAGAIMREYGITSQNAQCQLIAQMAHECVGFTRFEEGLSYTAARLVRVWPSRFPSLEAAQPYARNPKALANKVYNGRMGNRPGSDDGWNFRGSGPLQHTGATEFARVERRTKLPVTTNPSLLRSVANADAMWRAGCSYFVDRGALAPANAGQTAEVTKKVNGGLIGLADRQILVKRTQAAFLGETITVAPTTVEQADDAQRKTKQTGTVAAGGGAASGSGAKQSGLDTSTAIMIGVVFLVVVGVVAVAFWRKWKAKQADVETMQLQSIEARMHLPAIAA